MLIFSGSLMLLVGLAGLVGLMAKGRPSPQEEEEKPLAPEGDGR
jgi:hypothetical protein